VYNPRGSTRRSRLESSSPISACPENPHWFSWRGRPVILVSSGDIYYDVFSPRHDFAGYLDALAAHGSNFTRMYPAGCTAFVPQDGDTSILPWVRLDTGAFDLDRWDPAYFRRLHAFMEHAARREIIVDVCLFNGFTKAWAQINNYCWPLMPLNPARNIQGEGCADMDQFTTLQVPANVRRQRDYVRKICTELDRYDNLLYDTSDEPDCYGSIPASLADPWVETVMNEIVSADTRGHMIAQTHIPPLERGTGRDWCRDRRTSWLNAEYLRAIMDLPTQYDIGRPYVLIETLSPGESPLWDRWWSTMGLVMSGDFVAQSRIHAWSFLTGGGAGFLEWSAHYHPAGPAAPGEPQATILRQKKVLRDFLYGFAFEKMHRFTGFRGAAAGPTAEPAAWATAIAEPGNQYALYLNHSSQVSTAGDNGYYAAAQGSYEETLRLEVPEGSYRVEWIDPSTGRTVASTPVEHAGGACTLRTPRHSIDIALAVRKAGSSSR
jgi:hypothetical protein